METLEQKKLNDLLAAAKKMRDEIGALKVKGEEYAELTIQRELYNLFTSGKLKLNKGQSDSLKEAALGKLRGKYSEYAKASVEAIMDKASAIAIPATPKPEQKFGSTEPNPIRNTEALDLFKTVESANAVG